MSSPTRRPSKHLDPKAPFVVDTHDLGRSPGTMREITRHVQVPRPIGNYVIAIPEGAPMDLAMRLTAVVEGVLISGRKREIDLDDEDPLPQLIDEMANIEPAVIDAAVLNLPYKPLCGPDCPGLCAECGEPLAADPTHHHEPADSRWAGLSGLVFEDSASVGDTKHLSDDGSSLLEQEES
jgi:uncharacterized protein